MIQMKSWDIYQKPLTSMVIESSNSCLHSWQGHLKLSMDSVLASCPCALLLEFARVLLSALIPVTHSSPRDHQFLSLARGLPSLWVCLTHHPPVQLFKLKTL